MIQQSKPSFIKIVYYNIDLLGTRLKNLKKKYGRFNQTHTKENELMIQKLDEHLRKIQWRLEHFIKSDTPLDYRIEQSFLDMIRELEWRLKEFELVLQGKDITDDNEIERMNQNITRR